MRAAAALLIAAALAGCENKEETVRLKAEAAQARELAQKAQADATKVKTEMDALAAELPKLKQEAETAKAAKAAAEEALAKAKPEKEALVADMAKLKQDLETAKAAAAASKPVQAVDEAAKASIQKEKDAAATEVAKARSASAEAAKQVDELKSREKGLSDKLAAKMAEAEKAQAAVAALEKQVQEARAKADQASSALRERLTSAGKGVLAPNLTLPVTFTARKGEKIKWAWTLTDVPPDLAVEALEFVVMGPSEAKAYGVRAGVEKKDDTGCIEAGADGRWTLFWMNRHPSAPLTIDYTVSLDPSGAAPPRKSGG
jgi:hypothetical protein